MLDERERVAVLAPIGVALDAAAREERRPQVRRAMLQLAKAIGQAGGASEGSRRAAARQPTG